MKTLFFLCFSMFLLATALPAQTRSARNNLSAGVGIQQYNGDLGNSFFDFEEEWYGVARITYSRYLTPALDAQAFASMGDIGRCFDGVLQPGEHILMLRSRFTTLGVGLKYKFANGRLLKEDSKIAPYLYVGAALNNHRDVWIEESRVNEGTYTSVNAGIGLTYRLCSRFQLGYNLGLGYFTTDAIDYISKGSNDMYLQNTFSVGMDF